MPDWLPLREVILVAAGALASGLAGYFANRQSSNARLRLAREQRNFDAGREAYRAASAGIGYARLIAARQRPLAAEEMEEAINKIIVPVREARTILGLPLTGGRFIELIASLSTFADALNAGDQKKVEDARDKFVAVITRHESELMDAWEKAVKGPLADA